MKQAHGIVTTWRHCHRILFHTYFSPAQIFNFYTIRNIRTQHPHDSPSKLSIRSLALQNLPSPRSQYPWLIFDIIVMEILFGITFQLMDVIFENYMTTQVAGGHKQV